MSLLLCLDIADSMITQVNLSVEAHVANATGPSACFRAASPVQPHTRIMQKVLCTGGARKVLWQVYGAHGGGTSVSELVRAELIVSGISGVAYRALEGQLVRVRGLVSLDRLLIGKALRAKLTLKELLQLSRFAARGMTIAGMIVY